MILRLRLAVLWLALIACASSAASAQEPGTKGKTEPKRPTLSLKASPVTGIAPLRVYLTGELKGGRDDDEDLYCSTIEWSWGDGTESESSADCDPFEAGKSTIQRRFSARHMYELPGRFQVYLRLKKKDRTVLAASTPVQVAGSSFSEP